MAEQKRPMDGLERFLESGPSTMPGTTLIDQKCKVIQSKLHRVDN